MWSSTHDDDVSRVGLLLSLSPAAVVVSSVFSMTTSSSSVSSLSMASRFRGVAASRRRGVCAFLLRDVFGFTKLRYPRLAIL